ncbi:MAG: ATP-dependent sacrificial sulfur transferase LarE [Oscillospiraceae bacterium]|nr:ATP-dependent sacrificial sulfur transferase LarE [Oscillospiraceae bacterium]
MTLTEKEHRLEEILRSAGSVYIAYSAGVDSTFLLRAAYDITGAVTAVTMRSPFMPEEEIEDSISFCKEQGIPQIIVDHDTLTGDIVHNPPDRCYRCKRVIFSRIKSLAEENGIVAVFDGSNADDDPADRPGMRALEELGIRSPLREAGLTKADIRALSRKMGLPTWDKPSLACLATRIATGERLTKEKLAMTAAAERYIRSLGIAQCRVRMQGDTARIETDPDDIPRLAAQGTASAVYEHLRGLGYTHVSLDLGGYGRR